jgi:predicted dehydrogenase
MNIAILGCGYVANMYLLTLTMHPELKLIGVMDIERSRAENLARITGTKVYPDLQSLLNDSNVDLVVNLTIPQEHFVTSRACLEAGKHVYTEKPLAMEFSEAATLVDVAESKGLMLASAPCTLMSQSAQTLWHAVRDNLVGKIRLIYAEMDDGMISSAPVRTWVNEAGTAWPYVNEFETGCTVEHAGYVLTWLVAIFGPVESVTAFSDTLIDDKISGQEIAPADDFTVACIKFRNGIVLRMTNGIYAEHDHRLRLFGDDGVLLVNDPRNDISPVRLQRYYSFRRKRFLSPWSKKLPFKVAQDQKKIVSYRGSQVRDFCRVISDMHAALKENRQPYFSANFALHVTEITLVCQNAKKLSISGAMPYQMTTTFEEMEPLSWK